MDIDNTLALMISFGMLIAFIMGSLSNVVV